MKDFIEQQVVGAVRGLLSGQVNAILHDCEFIVPVIEFGEYCGDSVATPVIELASCEQTEKERIIRLDAYSLTIVFSLPPSPESELHCYAFAGAIGKAVFTNPTLGGVADWCSVTGKKFIPPKKPHCGEGWKLEISLRVTVEQWARTFGLGNK